jgi:hypothetical protein
VHHQAHHTHSFLHFGRARRKLWMKRGKCDGVVVRWGPFAERPSRARAGSRGLARGLAEAFQPVPVRELLAQTRLVRIFDDRPGW